MKKTISILCIAIALFCCKSTLGQTATSYKTQRDSINALYIFGLDKYDSVTIANMALKEKIDQIGTELTSLKSEISGILQKRKESQAALDMAKKLIEDQAALIEKLEAEVKRLSQTKKPGQ